MDEERLTRMEVTLGEIKGVLSVLVPMIQGLQGQLQGVHGEQASLTDSMSAMRADIARIEGRLADLPTARDFGRLEGRVAELSERLPTAIGYIPPAKPAA